MPFCFIIFSGFQVLNKRIELADPSSHAIAARDQRGFNCLFCFVVVLGGGGGDREYFQYKEV